MNAEDISIIAEKFGEIYVARIAEILRAGVDQKMLWEFVRDDLADRFKFPLLAAANLTRLMFAAAVFQLGPEFRITYTPEDLATCYQLIIDNLEKDKDHEEDPSS